MVVSAPSGHTTLEEMSLQAANQARLSTMDLIFLVMDHPQRPLDFVLVLHFKKSPGLEALQTGARSARNLYPTTGSYIDKKQWLRFNLPRDEVTLVEASSDPAVAIEDFLESPFDPRREVPVQQLLIENRSDLSAQLVTRFHHTVADGLSAALWLEHQLGVACGQESPVAEVSPLRELDLLRHPSPVRRSRFAYRGPSECLCSSGARSLRKRHWFTVAIPTADLRERSGTRSGFTYNDLLATCALEVFRQWNRAHGKGHKVGLWVPVNIRKKRSSGFGNGTSRLRIYARYAQESSLLDKARQIHRQVFWSSRHGEWAVPRSPPLMRLPLQVMGPLLRGYLNRPWVDMATGTFSHVDRGQDRGQIDHVEKIECIGLMGEQHGVAINGATYRDQTWFTFTYDPGLLSAADIQRLVGMYEEQIALARKELR